jgi:hypothetical protein
MACIRRRAGFCCPLRFSLSVGGGIGSSEKGDLRNPRSARSFRPYKVAGRRTLASHRREIAMRHPTTNRGTRS